MIDLLIIIGVIEIAISSVVFLYIFHPLFSRGFYSLLSKRERETRDSSLLACLILAFTGVINLSFGVSTLGG